MINYSDYNKAVATIWFDLAMLPKKTKIHQTQSLTIQNISELP